MRTPRGTGLLMDGLVQEKRNSSALLQPQAMHSCQKSFVSIVKGKYCTWSTNTE